MRNEINANPDAFSAAVPTNTASGAAVIVLGAVPAVTATREGEGGNIAGRASVQTRGIFSLPTTDAVAAEGTAVYLTSAGVLTTTSSGNTPFGRTVALADGTGATKASGAGSVNVRLGKV